MMDYFDARQYLNNLPSRIFIVSTKSGKILYSNRAAEKEGIFAGVNFAGMLSDINAFSMFGKNSDRDPQELKLIIIINENPYTAKLSYGAARYNGLQSWIVSISELEDAKTREPDGVILGICGIYTETAGRNKTRDFLELTASSVGAFCATLYEKKENRFVIKEEWRNKKNVVIPVLSPNFEDNTESELTRLRCLKRAKDVYCVMYKKIYGTEGAVLYSFETQPDTRAKSNLEKYVSIYKTLSPDTPDNNSLVLIRRGLDSLNQGVVVWNKGTKDLIYENKAYRELFGFMCERKMTAMIGARLNSDKLQYEDFRDAKDNDYIITHTINRVRGENIVTTLIYDITEYRKAEIKLDMMAKTDALTGLLNRRAGIEKLETIYRECRKNRTPLTVCFADIDGLKFINDTYGHGAGDLMIVSVADILKKYVDISGASCRLGGDEFVLILPGLSKEKAALLSAQIENETKKCLVGESQGISMSFGFKEAEYGHQETADTLISIADSDMYIEKRKKYIK